MEVKTGYLYHIKDDFFDKVNDGTRIKINLKKIICKQQVKYIDNYYFF